MAVAPMRRFELVGHANTREAVLAAMQQLGVAHVEDGAQLLDGLDESSRPQLASAPDPAAAESRYQTVTQCLAFIDRYAPRPGLLEKLKQPRLPVSPERFRDTVTHFRLQDVAERVRDLETRLAASRGRIAKLEVLRDDLEHWTHSDFHLDKIQATHTVHVSLAVVDTAALPKLEAELAEITPLVHLHILERGRPSTYLVLFVQQAQEEAVGPVLKKYGLRTVEFGDLRGTPKEARAALTKEIQELYADIDRLEEQAAALASERDALLILADHHEDRVEAARVQTQMLHTRSSYVLAGWVPEPVEADFTRTIHDISPAISLTVRDPRADERPPVLLRNQGSEPFEMITHMYGTPLYQAVDPTPWFAPWFAIFFGVCLTDAGYGIVLMAVTLWAMRTLRLEGGARQLVRILFFGGVCTLLAGAVTGGWFGISPESLPPPLDRIVVLQPMVDSELALFTTFVIGIVHVLLGLFIKMRQSLRRRDVVAAVLDQGVWMLFILSVTPLIYVGIFGGTIANQSLMSGAKWTALACTGLVVLTGKREGNLFVRPLMGALKLYDMVGYFGDVLSYSRLLALGLATGAIGGAINLIGGQIIDGMPWGLGYLIAIPLMVAGHAFNIVINCLGAFIHSMRLQFIEFFGKFFEDGGTPFRPFAQRRARIVVEQS